MQTAAAMVAAAIVVVAVAGRMITSFAIHPKHINEYGTVHHFIHVLQRGKVICASHIAVFETIVKDLSAGPAASEKESISRELPGVSVQDPAVQDPSATTDQSLSPQSKAHRRVWLRMHHFMHV